MRQALLSAILPAAALFALASCSGPEIIPRPAPPVPVPAPTPPPAPAPAPTLSADWRDWPLTEGTWVYRRDQRGSIALFGAAGADAEVTLRCDRERNRIYLSRRGEAAPGVPLTIRTTSMARTLAMLPTGGAPAYVAAELGVRDSLLDAMAFSRGRMVLEGGGLPVLVVPVWAEISRVVEDCRG